MTRPKAIIVTGGAGSLGSRTALAIEAAFPGKYHLILTVRNETAPITTQITSELVAADVDFSWESLDLSSLPDVKGFVARVKSRFASGNLKSSKLSGLINSAALSLYSRGKLTADGFDPVYQINVLSPFLLSVEFLSVIETGGLVVNVASSAHNMGRVGYFWEERTQKAWAEQTERDKIGLTEGLARYGSSKLLARMMGIKLQQELDINFPTRHIQVVSLDPGGMGGDSRLGDGHWVLNAIVPLLSALGPLVRIIDPAAFNSATVPAKCITNLFDHEGTEDGQIAGKYFILNKESASSVLSRDASQQQTVWDHLLQDLGMKAKELQFQT